MAFKHAATNYWESARRINLGWIKGKAIEEDLRSLILLYPYPQILKRAEKLAKKHGIDLGLDVDLEVG